MTGRSQDKSQDRWGKAHEKPDPKRSQIPMAEPDSPPEMEEKGHGKCQQNVAAA